MNQRFEIEALGTRWIIEYTFDRDIGSKLGASISEFEKRFSRFESNSIISQLNGGATIKNAQLMRMLALAETVFVLSRGRFDIRIGGVLAGLGYGAESSAATGPTSKTYKDSFNFDDQSVRLVDCQIDLGGIGKGFLIDELANGIETLGCAEYTVNGGGDIRLCSVSSQDIQLVSPFDPNQAIGLASGDRLAFASSAPSSRSWSSGEGTMHHIVDPDSHESTSYWAQSYVVADSTAKADALATAVLLYARVDEISVLAAESDAEVLVVDAAGRAHGQFGPRLSLFKN